MKHKKEKGKECHSNCCPKTSTTVKSLGQLYACDIQPAITYQRLQLDTRIIVYLRLHTQIIMHIQLDTQIIMYSWHRSSCIRYTDHRVFITITIKWKARVLRWIMSSLSTKETSIYYFSYIKPCLKAATTKKQQAESKLGDSFAWGRDAEPELLSKLAFSVLKIYASAGEKIHWDLGQSSLR